MRKTPATSLAGQIQAMTNAALPLLRPPEHLTLRPVDEPFWAGIVRARARDEWIEADLVVAVHLARCQADIEREQAELDTEGTVVEVMRKGGPIQVMNPRVSVLEQLKRSQMALMRTLRMGGKVAGPAREMAGRRSAERNAAALRAEIQDEDLLAT